jgi:hypothetical protein
MLRWDEDDILDEESDSDEDDEEGEEGEQTASHENGGDGTKQ